VPAASATTPPAALIPTVSAPGAPEDQAQFAAEADALAAQAPASTTPENATAAAVETPAAPAQEQVAAATNANSRVSEEEQAARVERDKSGRGLAIGRRGTDGAKERPAMQDRLFQRQLDAKAAVATTGEKFASSKAATVLESTPAIRVAAPNANLGERPANPETFDGTLTAVTTPAAATAAPETPAAADVKPVPSQAAQLTAVIEHVHQAIERFRTNTDQRQVNIDLRLHDGQQLSISLQMEGGEVKTLFKAESESMRQALEQSWAQFQARPSDRGVRLATAVFEAPPSQNGFNSDPRQQGQRERAFAEAHQQQQENPFAPLARGRGLCLATYAPISRPERAAASAGLQIYA
jgi:hypothetical protein